MNFSWALIFLFFSSSTFSLEIKYKPFKESERCQNRAIDFLLPKELADSSGHGRLIPILRKMARTFNPKKQLSRATFYQVQGQFSFARALSDLSVSGRNSFLEFKRLHQENELNENEIVNELNHDFPQHHFSNEELMKAAKITIDRAYQVAHAIQQGGESFERKSLGYIAVSGEDDPPYAPVNIPATEGPQHFLTVKVNDVKIETRFILVTSNEKRKLISPPNPLRSLPLASPLKLSPKTKVLVYIHGMDSRLEEASDLIRAMQISTPSNESFAILSFDLPNSGYATKLNHEELAPLTALGNPTALGFNSRGTHNTILLNFLENFIFSFINTLDQKIPIKNQIVAVMGGSLGGSLVLRLGRHENIDWLKRTILWSPASIWDGFTDGQDFFKKIAVKTAYERANFSREETSSRHQFFKEAFGGAVGVPPLLIVPAQPDMWWNGNWACKLNAREHSEKEREEIYHPNFRTWRWRLATEQLIYSHQMAPDRAYPRYLDNRLPTLFLCGLEDNFNFSNICQTSQMVARKMVNTPGEALFLQHTGHSLHNERPEFLLSEVFRFLRRENF